LLFDDLIGEPDQRIRDAEAKGFSRLEIDDHFVFGRLLHRQVGRFFTSEDPVDITGGFTGVVCSA
jgi:hypothetical protein